MARQTTLLPRGCAGYRIEQVRRKGLGHAHKETDPAQGQMEFHALPAMRSLDSRADGETMFPLPRGLAQIPADPLSDSSSGAKDGAGARTPEGMRSRIGHARVAFQVRSPCAFTEYSVDGLGVLQFENGIWSGLILDGHQRLLVCCADDNVRPESAELARLRQIWRDRKRYFEAALEFLRKHERDGQLAAGRSTPYGITIEQWDEADCVIEMLGPDKETVWRVGFRDQVPLCHAFDH